MSAGMEKFVVTCNKFKYETCTHNNLTRLLRNIAYKIDIPSFETISQALDFIKSNDIDRFGYYSITPNENDNTFKLRINIDDIKTFYEEDLYDIVRTITKYDPGIDQSTVKINKVGVPVRTSGNTTIMYDLWECPVIMLKCSSGESFEFSMSEKFATYLDDGNEHRNLFMDIGSKSCMDDYRLKLCIAPMLHAISRAKITPTNFNKVYKRVYNSNYKHLLTDVVSPFRTCDTCNDNAIIMSFFRFPKFPIKYFYRRDDNDKYRDFSYVSKIDYYMLKYGKFGIVNNIEDTMGGFAGLLTLISGDVWTFETRQVDKGLQREIQKSINSRININCVLM